MSAPHIVVVGNGVAGHNAALAARERQPEARVTLIAREPVHFYNRLGLTPFLAGQLKRESLLSGTSEDYAIRGVEVRLGVTVTALSPDEHTLTTSSNERIAWDRLVLCAGAEPFVPPVPGLDHPAVRTLRTLDDADWLAERAGDWDCVVILGGGLLGLEAAYALRSRGAKRVIVVELSERLLPRQLDQAAAALLEAKVRDKGIEVRCRVGLDRVDARPDGGMDAIVGGEAIEANAVLVSVGIRSNLALAQDAGLETGRGVVVDDAMRTSHPDVFAAGDIAEHRGVVWGLWPLAMMMGSTAGANAAGGDETLAELTSATFLKVLGVPVFSAGVAAEPPSDARQFVLHDEKTGSYTKLVVRDNHVVGAILMGDASRMMAVRNAVEQHVATGDIDLDGEASRVIELILDGR